MDSVIESRVLSGTGVEWEGGHKSIPPYTASGAARDLRFHAVLVCSTLVENCVRRLLMQLGIRVPV